MCDRCGVMGSHDISLSERPAHRLVGRFWEGSNAQAASGAIHPLIEGMKQVSASRSGLWRSPIVGLSWNDRPDGFRYFVGIAVEEGEAPGTGLEILDMPEMTLASSWHGAEDGNVVEHYLRMIEWLSDMGLQRDFSQFHQREEYPPDIDLAAPLTLRLMMPVVGRLLP
jgi:predicted transcriptional regulator YdeE